MHETRKHFFSPINFLNFICWFIIHSFRKLRLQLFIVSPYSAFTFGSFVFYKNGHLTAHYLSRSLLNILNIASPSLCGMSLGTFLYVRFNDLLLLSLLSFKHLFMHTRFSFPTSVLHEIF